MIVVVLSVLVWPAGTLAATGPAVVGSDADATDLSGVTSVAVSGNYAYTTAYWPGQLTVLDVSNPSAPIVVGSAGPAASLENGSNVTVSGNDAFVVSKNRNASTAGNDDGSGNSLTVVNISNPASPTIEGTVHDSSRLFGAYGVAVKGSFAFVAAQGVLAGQPASPDTSYGSFSVIDLATMSIVANIDNGSLPAPWTNQNAFKHATSVAIGGNYAYVTAFYDSRVTVVDISNPLSPTIVASLRDPTNLSNPSDLAVHGDYLYVTNQSSSLSRQFTVLDISNPAKPVVVGSLSNIVLAGAYRVRVRGDFAYLSALNTGTVAAIDISDPASPRLADFVQDPHLNSTSGLDVDSSGSYVIASSPEQSGQHNPPYPPFPPAGGQAVTGTVSAIQLDPTPISITIASASEPQNPTVQSSASFSFSAGDTVSAVRCGLDGAALGPCTSQTTQLYSSLSAGSHTFTVGATDAAGNTALGSYRWTVTATTVAPQNTSPPTISGSARQGSVLTASNGSWSGSPAPALSDRWQRCDSHGERCSVIAGRSATRYTVVAGDVGFTLRLVVTGANGGGSSSAVSAPTSVVSGTQKSGVVARTEHAWLVGVAAGKARLHVTLVGARAGVLLGRVAVVLPRGLSFSSSKRSLAKGVFVLDVRGKRLRFAGAVVRGSLVVALRRPVASVQVLIAGPAMRVSKQLAASVKKKRTKTLEVTITITGAASRTTHARLRLRVG